MQGPESYVTARDRPGHCQPQATELYTQPELGLDQHKVGIEYPMQVLERVFSNSELHFLLVNEFNHFWVTQMKNAITQAIKKTLAKSFELGFQAANTRKIALFHFLKMYLLDRIPERTLKTILMKSVDLSPYSNAFLDALVKIVLIHVALAQDQAQLMVRTPEKTSKTEWKRNISSSSIHYH